MFRVSCLGIWWRHDIWISKMLKVDYLKNEKSFWGEGFFLVLQVLSFRHTKQTSKNVADATSKVENFGHLLDCSLLTWGWSRYFANCAYIFFPPNSISSLLMHADLMVNFRGNFLMAASYWISWPISSQYCRAFWWIDFSPQVTCQFDVRFKNCYSEFKR